MALDPQNLLSRWLQVVRPGEGEVRALQTLLHMPGVVRFVGLYAATIIIPAILLGYFGVTSIRGEEVAVMAEVERDANTAAARFMDQTRRGFRDFERRVTARLESGRSPLESQERLHPHLAVALRFSKDLELVAPFRANELEATEDIAYLFEGPYAQARRRAAEEGTSFEDVAESFGEAALAAKGRAAQGRSELDRAMALARAGLREEATLAFEQIVVQYGNVRDPWGFRLGDLARLGAATMMIQGGDQAAADETLRALVREVLATRWMVGEGAEPAVVRRALAMMEPTADPEWIASARERAAVGSQRLYNATRLVAEAQAFVEDASEGARPGAVSWFEGDGGVWATLWWGDDFYAFAFDQEALLSELKADARGSVRHDAPVAPFVMSPDESIPDDILVHESLGPWFSGWAFVVTPRDAAALERSQKTRRNQRFGIVLFIMSILATGVVLITRLVSRELDVATMKADFAASVSHELRSPITQIRIKAEALMLGLADTEEEQQKYYHSIVRESERLSRLVDNVLDFAAIERGAKSYLLRPGDIVDTVIRGTEGIMGSLELQGTILDLDLNPELPEVAHDNDAVVQCLVNLVSNAAKYSEPGSTVRLTSTQREDGGVDISVHDEGIGMTPEDVANIFEPFYRSSDSNARKRKGTGIGLTITRYIMQAHGGDVVVSSQTGKGSTFTLRFPVEPSAENTTWRDSFLSKTKKKSSRPS